MTGQVGYSGLPKPDSLVVDGDLRASFVWYKFLYDLWNRTGGANVVTASQVILQLTAGKLIALLASSGQQLATLLTTSSAGGTAVQQTLLGSPWTFVAPLSGTLVVASGQVEIRRGATWAIAGLAGGALPLRTGDSARVTWYQSAPVVWWLPDG